MRPRSLLILLALLAVIGATLPAGAATSEPLCFGKRATIASNAKLITGTPGPDVIIAGRGSNEIDGLGGNDRICGGGGDDILRGDDGSDRLDGGDGWDTVGYGSSPAGVSVDLLAGTGVTPPPYAWSDTLRSIEYVDGSGYDDVLLGTDGVNYLWGWNGMDIIDGRGGFDFVDGGSGNDQLDGGSGRDILTFFSADTGVTVDLEAGASFSVGGVCDMAPAGGQPSGSDSIAGFEGVFGTPCNDTFVGAGGNEVFIGGICIDSGWLCADGDDSYDGGAGIDFVFLLFAPGQMVVDLSKGLSQGNGLDAYTAIEGISGSPFADTLIGSPGRDFLFGSGGPDSIFGEGGNDFLIGGPDDDAIDGGDGKDGCIQGEDYTRCENQRTKKSLVKKVLKGFRKGFRKN